MTITRIGDPRSGSGGQILPFSQATEAGGFVFVSGQVGFDAGGEIVQGGIVAETKQTMDNIVAILAKAGCTLADVVKANVWLDDTRDFAAFNRVYASYFDGQLPARSCVRSQIMIDAKVEIDVIACKAK
jgi:reactive intermediate/imine deaminase